MGIGVQFEEWMRIDELVSEELTVIHRRVVKSYSALILKRLMK